MKYTNKMIKRILTIQEFVETSNTLSRVYIDFGNKELEKEMIADKKRVYIVFCSSIYNVIVAIKDSKDIFEKSNKYSEFEEMINKKYLANDNRYYSKENYESNLFKIIETIRHQSNHFQRDDEDDTMLFEVYIDFNIVDNLRKIINDIFYEIYNEIDKEKIKNITLSKVKIQYSYDNFSKKINEIESKISISNKEIDKVFLKENERSIQLIKNVFAPNNLYDLYNEIPSAIEKFDLADLEIKKYFEDADKYINKNGTDKEKESMKLLKETMKKNESGSLNDYYKNMDELTEKLKNLQENSKTNE